MADVQSANRVIEVQGCYSDLKVGERDGHALFPRLGIDLCRINGNVDDEILQELSATDGSRRFVGSPDAVFQFHHAHD